MDVQGGGMWMRLSKSSKTNKWAQLYYLQCIKAMGIYCICMFYLNEQTICPILTGKHIKCTLIMHINILCKICFPIFDGYVLFKVCLRGLKTLRYFSTTQLLLKIPSFDTCKPLSEELP